MPAASDPSTRRLRVLAFALLVLVGASGLLEWLGYWHRPLRYDESYSSGSPKMVVQVYRRRGLLAAWTAPNANLHPLASYWLPEMRLYHTDGSLQLHGWCWPIRVQSGDFERDKPSGELAREGLWTGWHPGGKARALETRYSGGNQEGLTRAWHVNGRLHMEGAYRDGDRAGRWTAWHENGQKEWEGSFVAGQKHGPWTTWHANGQVRAEPQFDLGRQVGTETVYDENGKATIRRTWRAGREEGEREVFQADRRVVQQVRGDRLNGSHREYSLAGELLVEGQYEDDQMEGRWVGYTAGGFIEFERHYHKGQLHGRERVWSADGTLLSDGHYQNGQRQGSWKEWDQKGNAVAEGAYEDGQRHGAWMFYYPAQPARQVHYDRGAVVEREDAFKK